MAEYLPDFDNLEEAFDIDACPYLFEPEYTIEELREWWEREGNNRQRRVN